MILVTGGAGYIGSHIVKELINNGYDVISIDDNPTYINNEIEKGTYNVEKDYNSSFNDDKTNINAPETASNGLDSGCSSVIFLICITP